MKTSDQKWCREAHLILKSELARRGIGYRELSERLVAIGVEETVAGIRGKMHRGTFSFAWLLQCAEALGLVELKINLQPLQKRDDK